MTMLNSIVFKLGLSMVFLFLVVLFPMGYVLNAFLTNFYQQKAIDHLNDQTNKIISVIETSPEQVLKNNLAVALKMADHKAVVYDASRRLSAISDFADDTAGLQDQDWALLSSGTPVFKEWNAGNKSYLLVARPFYLRESFSGAVLIMTPADEVDSTLAYIRSILLLAGLGAILMIFGFTNILVPKLSSPLLAMEKATRQIAKGNLAIKLNEKSRDELGSLARAINDLVADLKRIQDSRREFFANIAHELRTPLTYIEGYIKLLAETQESEEQRKQIIPILVDETKRLKGLVDDLFELAQLEEGKLALTLEWVDLTEVIETSIEKVKLHAANKGIVINLAEEDVPLLLLDGSRMQQVFINLLDNAIRYTNEGMITVNLKSIPEFIAVEIEDTGIGIPKEELPFIFERFHRVEKSRSRNYGGTGLGLAIVKKLVEIQGGQIEVASQLGVGTTFTLKFPKPAEERVK